jgi:hypothetical protein
MIKLFALVSLLTLAAAAPPARGETATASGKCSTLRDFSSTALPTSYTTNAEILTGIAGLGYSGLEVVNTSSTVLFGSAAGNVANCASAVDNFVVPASGSIVLPRGSQKVGGKVCLRSSGSTVSSGLLVVCVR